MDTNIFKSKIFELPIGYDIREGFSKSMNKIIRDYEKIIRDNGYEETADKIKEFRTYLREMYRLYNKGMHVKAYHKFTTAIKHLGFQGEKLVFKLSEHDFYRARINDGNVDYKQNEMMHIPLNMRGKVRTERYSAPGLPCLYLGASSYVCWVELNRPSFDSFQVAKLKRKDDTDVFILDLSILPDIYLAKFREIISIEEYLCVWPIIAMCSIKVEHEKDDFKPEYVFPQFILEYIMSEKYLPYNVIGIKYASMKVGNISTKQYKDSPKTYVSYVFPTNSPTDDRSGIDLSVGKIFEVSGTASGKELQLLTDVARSIGIEWIGYEDEKEEKIKLYSSSGSSFEYEDSIFDRIEKALTPGKKNDKGKVIFEITSDTIETASNEDIDELFK